MSPQTVEHFFSCHSWNIGCHYFHLAMQGEKFTSDQWESYKSTRLSDNHILIDKGDCMMKFNFPGIANCLICTGIENIALQHSHVGSVLLEKTLSIRIQEWWSHLTILRDKQKCSFVHNYSYSL